LLTVKTVLLRFVTKVRIVVPYRHTQKYLKFNNLKYIKNKEIFKIKKLNLVANWFQKIYLTTELVLVGGKCGKIIG
jgi:hypothetical protein